MEEKKNREGKGGIFGEQKYLAARGEEKQRRGEDKDIWIRKIPGHFMRRRTEKENEENVWIRKMSGFLRRRRAVKEKKEIIRRRKSDDC